MSISLERFHRALNLRRIYNFYPYGEFDVSVSQVDSSRLIHLHSKLKLT